MQLTGKHPVVLAITANLNLNPAIHKCGTLFTNRGASGAVTISLPQLNAQAGWDGYWVEFQGEADQNLAFSTATANKAICINNLTATSLTCSTGSQKIGARMRATWDAGAQKWILNGLAVAATYTVA